MWYRIWNDGWIEQGGVHNGTIADAGETISLNIAFSNNNYTVVASTIFSSDYTFPASYYGNDCIMSSSTSSFTTPQSGKKIWYACGQGDISSINYKRIIKY